mgnify:FL=1
MKFSSTKVLTGPNYWSAQNFKLIQVMLPATPATTLGADAAHEIKVALHNQLPFSYEVHPQAALTFPYFLAQLAVALQLKAGIPLQPFYKAAVQKESAVIVFSYAEAETGLHTAKAALKLLLEICNKQEADVAQEVEELRAIWHAHKWGPSTQALIDEAARRNIPIMPIKGDAYVQLGYGKCQQRIAASLTSHASCIAVDIAGHKEETKNLLTQAFIPAPRGVVLTDVEKLTAAIEEIGFPVVIKPLNANQGKGATTNICNQADAERSFYAAQKYSKEVIVEKFIQGRDFRVLVVDGKMVAAAMRTPASITGDGVHTVKQLIEAVNAHPQRGNGHECELTTIKIDDDTADLLEKKGFTMDTVLPAGKEVWLKSTANLSTGGTATNITAQVHPANVSLFERAARVVGLDVCGIDVMAPDLETPIKENGGAIIEINAAPGLRMHLQPSFGEGINVAAPIIDMLFKNNSGRIPLVAITGTNGKTTTTRLIAYIAQQAGFYTGYTTTDGIYINGELIEKGDCSGPQSGRFILRDNAVDFAVLECARGGILRSGLCFDECSSAVVTNVAADHLGLEGIDTLEQLAQVKSVVARSASVKGYAIFNADDDLVYAMKDTVQSKVALFSLHANNIRIQRHCDAGGLAAYCEDGYIILQKGAKMLPIEEVKNIPITFEGKAEFNIANVLAACLAAYTSHIKPATIRKALLTFIPCGETTPGRANVFHFPGFKVMLDYAHNPHGLRALGKLITSFDASIKVGVIAGVGDRRDEDIMELGRVAAKIFDHIIIRHDKDLRGRLPEEFDNLLTRGIHQVSKNKKITILADETEAVHFVLEHATANSFITFLCEDISCVYDEVKAYYDTMTQTMRTAS